jgi:hypothetical protein
VSFLLQVADADEARGKLHMRQVHCNPAQMVLLLQVMTVRDRTVNAAIGAVIQNVEILSPSSLGQGHGCQLTAFFSFCRFSTSGVRVLVDVSDDGGQQVQDKIQKVQPSHLPSKRATH